MRGVLVEMIAWTQMITEKKRQKWNMKQQQKIVENILKIVDFIIHLFECEDFVLFLVNLTHTHNFSNRIGVRTNHILFTVHTVYTALSMNFKYDEINKY